jgi:phosphatidylinositol 3-kinase
MDQLLRRENLDLRLTPYRVLATSSRHGMVEFVDASAIAEILSTEGSILSFFRRHNPQVAEVYEFRIAKRGAYTIGRAF